MVLRIAIVEDEQGFRDMLINEVEEWSRRTKRDVQIHPYIHGDAFLFDWEDAPQYDAVFLDIMMPGPNGMEVGHTIRQSDRDIVLVFVTSMIDHVLEGYEIGAKRYLLKPAKQEDVDICMNGIWDAVNERKLNTYLFRSDGKQLRLPFRDIMYFENFAHYVSLHSMDEEYEFKINLKDIETELPRHFIRCHRSFIVNMDYVYAMDSKNITLRNKQEIPISQNRLAAVQREFTRSRKR